jgi:hypothetical protein
MGRIPNGMRPFYYAVSASRSFTMSAFKIIRSVSTTPLLVALAVLALSVGSARAAVPGYVKQACKADYKKFCPDYEVGSPALRACMVGIAHQLSPRCIDALERSGESKRRK